MTWKLSPERPLQMRLMGDWGAANLTRICGWIAQELTFCTDLRTRSTIHTGRGMGDNIAAVGRGEVDIALTTPAVFARLARAGRGPFAQEPYPTLRAIGTVPHDDALVCAVRAGLGVSSFAELRALEAPLRIAMAPDDGQSFMGFAAAALLEACGLPIDEIEARGGDLVLHEHPSQCLQAVADGRADVVIQEAIMTPWWSQLADQVELRFLAVEDEAAARLAERLGFATKTLAAGYLRGMDEPLTTLEFDGWLVLARADMADDVAALVASILAETAEVLERGYRHIPVRNSPLTYPIAPTRLATTPIPLHPGAESYYRATGALRGTQAT